ncbi:MAG: hypothetical protein HYY78_05720 [Betaproteobacteria bacterium]|nr:hypothetical protein [Betaproteobacteria bacterium]
MKQPLRILVVLLFGIILAGCAGTGMNITPSAPAVEASTFLGPFQHE